jgi:hypothetical protein
MLERFDYIFSYWIVLWYVLYKLNLVSYNPKGALIPALLANFMFLCIMLYYSYSYTIFFVIALILMKVVPLWSVWNDPYRLKDVYATIIIFVVYLVWIRINNVDLNKLLNKQIHHIYTNKPIGPGMYLINVFV